MNRYFYLETNMTSQDLWENYDYYDWINPIEILFENREDGRGISFLNIVMKCGDGEGNGEHTHSLTKWN